MNLKKKNTKSISARYNVDHLCGKEIVELLFLMENQRLIIEFNNTIPSDILRVPKTTWQK